MVISSVTRFRLTPRKTVKSLNLKSFQIDLKKLKGMKRMKKEKKNKI